MEAAAATTTNHLGKILISNHSYGSISGWNRPTGGGIYYYGIYPQRKDYKFGLYSSIAREWDRICTNAPYYLPFKAAGNDRSHRAPNNNQTFYYLLNNVWTAKAYDPATDPFSDGYQSEGYDTIDTVACAKNVLTIGAVNDAVDAGKRFAANGTMSTFSSWGPTDDGRIKPDLVANGVGVYSTYDTDTNAYASLNGTSMATPNASGSALLLQHLYAANNGTVMRASTLKALLIQTATDLGRPGPDFNYGWGLIDVAQAAFYIKNPNNVSIIEGSLSTNKPVDTYTIAWSGLLPVRGTLCWTDPPGNFKNTLDDSTRVLVNDLDLRAFRGATTNLPYVMIFFNPLLDATLGDNNRDNVEQILIASPSAGTYTFTVSCKTALTKGEQKYALILSEGLPNLTPYQLAGWSDKIVTSTLPGTTTNSPVILSTDNIYVDMSAINTGLGTAAAGWNLALYVDGVLKASLISPELGPNLFTFAQDVNIGKLAPGSHTFRLKADTGGTLAESSENDNEYTRTVVVLPANDDFANAQTLTNSSGTVTGANGAATKQAGEPNHSGYTGGASVWYQWTAPFTGTATIDTFGSKFDTVLAVYTGVAVNSLTHVASNNEYYPVHQSRVSFEAVAGTTYRIAVDGYNAETGPITLHYQLVPPASVVLNNGTAARVHCGN
jgi:hypothetical protein